MFKLETEFLPNSWLQQLKHLGGLTSPPSLGLNRVNLRNKMWGNWSYNEAPDILLFLSMYNWPY